MYADEKEERFFVSCGCEILQKTHSDITVHSKMKLSTLVKNLMQGLQ